MHPQTKDKWEWASLLISRFLFAGAAVVSMLALASLSTTVGDQKQERDCRFELTTETDRIDSDIMVKQAKIFEAAILRPNPDGRGSTPEMERLADDLRVLIEDQSVAYERRDDAKSRCDTGGD